MGQKLKMLLSVAAGIIIGALINTCLIEVGLKIIPSPLGLDLTTAGNWQLAIQKGLLESNHFLFPFLAHALGTFVGAYLAILFSPLKKRRAAYIVGFFFLTGGIIASMMIPAPRWFIAIDLLLAYIPMAFIAGAIYFKSISRTHKTKAT